MQTHSAVVFSAAAIHSGVWKQVTVASSDGSLQKYVSSETPLTSDMRSCSSALSWRHVSDSGWP